MPWLRDLVFDWQRGVQAVARGDWGCALRLFSGVPGPPAKMCFNVGCVHLLAGDPEAALRVSQGAPGFVAETPLLGQAVLWHWGPYRAPGRWAVWWGPSCRDEPRPSAGHLGSLSGVLLP